MVTRVVVLALPTLVMAACSLLSHEPRMLPNNRDEAVLYVALGDSTVEGIGATQPERTYVSQLYDRLRIIYPAARVANLGEAGATAADVVARQLPRAVELHPHLITLSVGPNDITTGVPVQQYERHVDAILEKLRRETQAVVVVNLLPDLAITPRFRGTDAREAVGQQTVFFNQTLQRQSREHGAAVVDLYTPSRTEVPQRPELIADDGYHPSDIGYARWAELMWRGIEPRIPRHASRLNAGAPPGSERTTAPQFYFFFVPQGFFAAHGFLAAQGFFAPHGFFAAQGFAPGVRIAVGLTFMIVPLSNT